MAVADDHQAAPDPSEMRPIADYAAEVERLEATTHALAKSLAWAVRDGRAHGVSACICVRCEDARATLADYEAGTG